MPDPESIRSLKRLLGTALEPQRVFHAPVWGDPQAMSKALREIRRQFGGASEGRPNTDVLQRALRSFAQTQTIASFNDLKYVCYGVTVPLAEGSWRVIDRPPLFDRVLELVNAREGQPKQFRRCYQGLLNAYFCFDKQVESAQQAAANWGVLGKYLDGRLANVRKASRQRGEPPPWLELLHQNRNLFGEEPCARYARALMAGDPSSLRTVCSGLGIPDNTWVWDEALLAYVALVCKGSDRAYREGLKAVLDLVNGRADLRMPEGIARRATAMSTVRYAKCADRSEHTELRDTAIQRIGNPWLRRAAWDAEVADESARQMVEGWLKRRLIKDFFELLAQDGGADLRRLNYWLKWEPKITDMWFVLGADARRNPLPEFKALRERMAGRDRVLVEPTGSNNAFVMRIGPLLVIEFGVTGNACYVFAASDFKTNLELRELTLNGKNPLKQMTMATRLSHMSSWEARFDAELASLLASTPASKGELSQHRRPATPSAQVPDERRPGPVRMASDNSQATPAVAAIPTAPPTHLPVRLTKFNTSQIVSFCRAVGVSFDDKRDREGGCFWVYLKDPAQHRTLARMLEELGFCHALNKGYWLKDES
jgi:hypothetical protein